MLHLSFLVGAWGPDREARDRQGEGAGPGRSISQ